MFYIYRVLYSYYIANNQPELCIVLFFFFVVVVIVVFYFISFYDTSFPSSLLFAGFESFFLCHTHTECFFFLCFLILCCPFSFSLVVKSFIFYFVHVTNTNKGFFFLLFFMRTLVFDVYYFILFILCYM